MSSGHQDTTTQQMGPAYQPHPQPHLSKHSQSTRRTPKEGEGDSSEAQHKCEVDNDSKAASPELISSAVPFKRTVAAAGKTTATAISANEYNSRAILHNNNNSRHTMNNVTTSRRGTGEAAQYNTGESEASNRHNPTRQRNTGNEPKVETTLPHTRNQAEEVWPDYGSPISQYAEDVGRTRVRPIEEGKDIEAHRAPQTPILSETIGSGFATRSQVRLQV